MSLKAKVLMPALLSAVITILIISDISYVILSHKAELDIQTMRDRLMEQSNVTLNNYVQVALTAVKSYLRCFG
ncbi:hypothetical protein ACFQDN_12980 [Pseudomonas asuensis]|uniref:Methyl-accepting chemotaxis protein n=1 Tax=Pseudomonas asuensis TaxID=1825787 RepID=A0ABQ2GQZ5_9PSED|nr:hypothetical protein [Pseudomonas asuensis]GGM07808.1 hypothetical protein GCM10009425_18840 [Pseudomonas asuensis]